MNFVSLKGHHDRFALTLSGPDELVYRFWFSIYVSVGIFTAFALPLVLLRNGFLIHDAPAYLDGRIGESELRDRIIYLPFYLIAPAAVFFANWRMPVGQMPSPRNGVLLFPIIALVHLSLFAHSTGLRILFWFMAVGGLIAVFRWRREGYIISAIEAAPKAPPRVNWLDLVAAAIIGILLLPASVERLAAHIGPAVGKVSYFVGPALYSYGTDLTPGISFFSNYGIGPGAIFFHLMNSSWENAAVTCVGFIVVINTLFYCAAYFLLVFMTGSRLLAFSIAVFTAVLNFATYTTFDVPSSYPVRYPFLLPFVLAFAWLCGSPNRLAPVAGMSIFAGLSLFWHTEVGVYLILAGAGGIFLAYGNRPREWGSAAVFVIASLAVFFACAWAFIGAPALTLSFVKATVRPITEFSGGWDGIPVKWNTVWSLLYNIPLQSMATATIGGFWFAMWFRPDSLSPRERQLASVLAMLSMLGMAMLVKWVNRSFDAVWHNNAVLLIIVATWWGHFLWRRSRIQAFLAKAGKATRFCAVAASLLVAVAVLLIIDDAANPYPYALRSYIAYPSIAKAIVAPSHLYDEVSYTKESPPIGWEWPTLLAQISMDDVSLIQKFTRACLQLGDSQINC